MENNLDPKEIKYGLIVVDPEQEGNMLDILHFCGYWEQPGKIDADSLRSELMEDESFGLRDVAHRLDILPAPDYILNEYLKIIKNES